MRGERVVILIAIAVFATLSISCAIASQGFLEADGCTHYMYARWAFSYPVYFVDIWGRPFKTALFAPAAATVGLIGVRVTSLAVAIAIALIAYAIARGQEFRFPALAVIFTLAQPLVFLHSFAELTELPFAMLLGLNFLAYQRRRWWAVALVAGLLPLSRPEGFGFVALTAIVLLCHRRWMWLWVLVAPILAWQVAGAMMYNEPREWWHWLPKHWPYAGDSLYARGSIFHFIGLLPAAVGPVAFPFLLIGFWKSFERDETKRRGESRFRFFLRHFVSSCSFRIDVLIAAIPLMILVGHSVLYATGKMASNGELRYMLIVAPFWGLLAARGWEWVFISLARYSGSGLGWGPSTDLPLASAAEAPSSQLSPGVPGDRARGWRSPYRWAAAAALLPASVQFAYRTLPLVQTEDWKTARRIAEWYRSSGVAQAYPHVLAAHPGIYFALDWPLLDPNVAEWNADNVNRCPAGTLAIWDRIYSEYNSDARKRAQIRSDSAWLWLAASSSIDHGPAWTVWLSPQRADGSSTPMVTQDVEHWREIAEPVYGIPPGFSRRMASEPGN